MKTYGKVFSKADIEAELAEEVSELQLSALVSELEDAFTYYFERDLLDEWQDAIKEGIPDEEECGDPSEFEVTADDKTVGKFLYTRQLVNETIGFAVEDRAFAFIADYFDRAFAKYFEEECERLWADIDSIVEDFEAGR